jgi:hypothetical protein
MKELESKRVWGWLDTHYPNVCTALDSATQITTVFHSPADRDANRNPICTGRGYFAVVEAAKLLGWEKPE